MSVKPKSEDFLHIGKQMKKHFTPNHSYEVIASRLGISKSMAQYHALVALGKLIYGLRQIYREPHGRTD